MKIKRDEQGHAVLDNERPVYVTDDGAEVMVDVEGLLAERDRLTRESGERDARLREALVRAAFVASPFLREQTVLPPEIAYSHFGRHFTVDESGGELRVVAKAGDTVMPSAARPGEPAAVDEALRALIDSSPHQTRLLKATPSGGGRASGGGHGDPGSGKLWQEMSTAERAAYVERHGADQATAKFEADRRK